MMACRGRARRSRTAASTVIGRNSVPAAILRWAQSCSASMADRPKNAPAAIAPVGERSQSRAARYMT